MWRQKIVAAIPHQYAKRCKQFYTVCQTCGSLQHDQANFLFFQLCQTSITAKPEDSQPLHIGVVIFLLKWFCKGW